MQLPYRSRRRRFVVSIFLANEPVEIPNTDRLFIPLTRLFTGSMAATNDREAAAKVWIKHVGKYRLQRLTALHAPKEIVDAQVDLARVANDLIPSSLFPADGGYMLDNQCETWFISVRRPNLTVKQRTEK